MSFDLTCVTDAFSLAHDATSAFDALTAEMVTWHAAGVYPENEDVIKALMACNRWSLATCKVYASNLLKWSKSGQTPKTISQVVKGHPEGHTKGKAGRKAGQGKGKSTTVAEPAKTTADDPRQFIRDLMARAVKVVDVADVDRFNSAATEMLALLSKHAGKAA